MAIKEQTESKFSQWCKKKGYFRLKLQVNIATRTFGGAMQATSMPSDFLVLTPTKTLFVEVKQVTTGDKFGIFRQQSKLTKVSKYYYYVGGYLLINFKAHKKLVYIEINEYNTLLRNHDKKQLKLSDIPEKNIFTWKTLELDK